MRKALRRVGLALLVAVSGAVVLWAQQPVTTVSGSTTAVTQTTSPWIVAGGGTAGSAASGVVTVQGVASMTPVQVSQATAANLNATVTGTGSAGSAAAGVVTVQGISSMTKLLVTPDSVALPANQSVNVSQINAVTPLMGIGLSGTGSQRQTIASANPVLGNALSTTPLTVNNAASVLTAFNCYNPNTVVEYLQIFDSASVSLGSTTPKWSVGIPALSTIGQAGVHLNHTNSIKAAVTTTATGSSAPSTAVDCNFSYE